jgi:hypothetical protein
MTVLEKITLQHQHRAALVLFKEGVFYKVYNEGVYWLQDKSYKIKIFTLKTVNVEVFSIGFPSVVLDRLQQEFSIEQFEGYMLCTINTVFDPLDYQEWRTQVLQQQQSSVLQQSQLDIINDLKKYPLANKTPIEAFLWLSEIQKKLNSTI